MQKIVIDPVTRIEGHMKVEAVVDGGVVKEAKSSGTLFRGFERILQGKDPRDAQIITQRICGVCPQSHATASARCLDSAFGIDGKLPPNGRIMRNLLLGANFVQSHILHFYHLAALDYVDVTKVAEYEGTDSDLNSVKNFIARGELGPFVPRYEGDYRLGREIDIAATGHYVKALDIRSKAHQMLAVFGGKMPHSSAVVPGGVTMNPTIDKIASFLWRLNEIRDFIDNVYIPDILAVAGAYGDYFEIGKGCGSFLAYGVFDLAEGNGAKVIGPGTVSGKLEFKEFSAKNITEHVKHSWYKGDASRNPAEGETVPQPGKEGAYS